jgi:hypothetical protein
VKKLQCTGNERMRDRDILPPYCNEKSFWRWEGIEERKSF